MNNQIVRNYLLHFPLLESLSPGELDRLAQLAQLKTAPKHTFIYLADEPNDYLCLLVKGIIKTGIYVPDGREIIKTVEHPYSIFGESGLTGEVQRCEFASTINQEIQYIVIKLDDFRLVMQQNFQLTQAVMLFLGERLRRAERQWESLILKDVRARIVEFLKENAGQRGRQVGFEMLVKHGLTQQDLANLVGASRQTVAAVLSELRKSNLIRFNRDSILIRDVEKLN